MAALEIKALEKRYNDVAALTDINLSIESGAFFTLLGPSGCGKTTLLRSIAGFLSPNAGEIHIGGRRIDTVPAHRRDIGMVFQDYAIFPHLNVADNVAFGLTNRKVPKADMVKRVEEALATVQLTNFRERMPQELSGGQQQRVGLARAMVIRPQVLLMDEPLSNLDAKLRIELREDIRDIQKKLGITTVYVTHDQEEALVISDQICVMNKGVVEQVATPWDVYKYPQRRFAAAFVGTMNFFPAQVADGRLSLLGTNATGSGFDRLPPAVEAAIRPEDVRILHPEEAPPEGCVTLKAKVEKLSFMGREAQYTLTAPDGSVILAHLANPETDLVARTGDEIAIALPWKKIVYFDPASGDRVGERP